MTQATSLTITVLGAGSSTGTPSIESGWGACDPHEPKNRRTRPSIMIEGPAGDGDNVGEGDAEQNGGQNRLKRLLIDTSPDLRQQLLRHEVRYLDGVLFTHTHADHLHGIDDIRGLNRIMKTDIPGWAEPRFWEQIDQRFGYVLAPLPDGVTNWYKPVITPNNITHWQPFQAAGFDILPMEQNHGYSLTTGFRIGTFAYTTDLVEFGDQNAAALDGVDTWYIGAFSWRPHPTHVHVEEALTWVERVKPRRAIFGHLSNGIDYHVLKDFLPKGVEPAFDGMRIEVAGL